MWNAMMKLIHLLRTSPLVDDDLDEERMQIKVTKKKNLENDIVDETLEVNELINIMESRNHQLENVIGNLNQSTLRITSPPKWRLDKLAYGILSDGPYQINLLSIKDIISSIRIDRDGQVRHICHKEEIDVLEYQVLTHEIEPTLKPLVEIIRGINAFVWVDLPLTYFNLNRDHVLHSLLYALLMCTTPKNSTCLFHANRMEWVIYKRGLILPYERKPRRDHGTRRGRHSTSSSSAFDQPSSSHLNDDDDDDRNDEGTSRASTPSPIRLTYFC
ncbi:hypothetical protein Tco_0322522 [Tanacetum coccineum]